MILDDLKNLRQYNSLFPGMQAAAEFLEKMTAQTPTGRYPIDGTNVYAMVQRYETKPEDTLPWECHDNYLDIQYLFSGQETILWAERNAVPEWGAYSESNDSTVSYGKCTPVPLTLSPGQFAIFTSHDAHKPKCIKDTPAPVVKVVVKMKIKEFIP